MQSELGTQKKSIRSLIMRKVGQTLFGSGLFRIIQRMHPSYLTVLNYHRIGYPGKPNEQSFKPNFSATPEEFYKQMALVSKWFNVISITDLVAYIHGKSLLPPYAAIISFDDGYLDNYQEAYRVLDKLQLPALIFLTTDYIDKGTPFFWDYVANCLYSSKSKQLELPVIGYRDWNNQYQLDRIVHELVEKLKKMPEGEKQGYLYQLPNLLGVEIQPGELPNLMMSWNQIRELKSKGIEFGAHTMTHPILSRVVPQKAFEEIEGSKKRIEDEIGEKITSFAYPNGQAGDFNDSIIEMVAQVGFDAAFTLVNGPCSYRKVKDDPYSVQRIFISHRDTLSRFALKVSGLYRFGSIA